MAGYQETHPWITFQFDTSKMSATTWMFLGEVRSKCQLIEGVPLTDDTAKKLHTVFLAKGAHATTAIEGNTLTESEVIERLEGRQKLPPSKEYLGQEVDNIVDAFNEITAQILQNRSSELTREMIEQYNLWVLKSLELDDGVVPGEIRTYSVGVEGARYRGAPADDCTSLVKRLCHWLNNSFTASDDKLIIPMATLKAIIAHVYIAWIHPFGDGNGRTARLVEFQILLSAGAPLPAAVALSNHYNSTRTEYYRQLRRSSESGGDLSGFVEYAVRGFVEVLSAELQTIKDQQWKIAWRDYVHEYFKGSDKTRDRRRRHLLLDLSDKDSPVPLSEIRQVSPRVAVDYSQRTERTLINDLKALVREGLVEKKESGYRAKRESILRFLPKRAKAENL